MMFATEGNLHMLAGGLRVKARVQHPQVKPRKDRQGWPWVFRYWADEIQPDGTVKTLRKYQAVGPSKGEGAITKKQAEIERDKFLAKLNAPTVEAAVQQVAATGVALFGEVAKMYEEGYLGRTTRSPSQPARRKTFYLHQYIVPRWGELRLNQIQPQAVEDWLHTTFDSWWTMHGVRAIMIRIYNYAEGHGLWEEGKRSPVSKAKLGKKRHKRERRILSFEETARVLARPGGTEPADHRNLHRHRRPDLGGARPEVEAREPEGRDDQDRAACLAPGRRPPEERGQQAHSGNRRSGRALSGQSRRRTERRPMRSSSSRSARRAKPLWDSGVRDALHQAAEAEGCDFPGLGPHSFRRANITWRQQVGGSAIEASKIAGHSDLEMTGEYTFVTPERQNELTRWIQQKLSEAGKKAVEKPMPSSPPEASTSLATTVLATNLLQ